MSVRTPLSDHQIERLLLARSAEVDIALLSRIQHVTERLPQRHAGWFPLQPQFDRRMLTLVAVVALLLAALAGAISLAGRTILPEPEPVRPDPIDELMGQFVASGLLRILPEGDPTCTSIPVDGPCFRLEAWWGVAHGSAEMADGLLALTALGCDPCSRESDDREVWESVKDSTTNMDPHRLIACWSFAVIRIPGCLEPDGNASNGSALGSRVRPTPRSKPLPGMGGRRSTTSSPSASRRAGPPGAASSAGSTGTGRMPSLGRRLKSASAA